MPDIDFAYPLLLLTLVVVPVAAVAYVLAERRRGDGAARFGSLALLPNLVSARPGLRRHGPIALLLVAVAVLLVGLARPQAAITRPNHKSTVVLTLDTSRSMTATDVAPDRLRAARAAARTLVAQLPPEARVAVVGFGRTVVTYSAPTTDRPTVDSALRALQVSGGTAVGDGLVRAVELLRGDGALTPQGKDGKVSGAIVLLTDGKNSEGQKGPLAAAAAAQNVKVPIFTVALGTPGGTIIDPATGKTVAVPADEATLRRIATATGGTSYQAADATTLRSIYDRIGRRLGRERAMRDISAGFVGAGTLFLLAAGALSLAWFRRLA